MEETSSHIHRGAKEGIAVSSLPHSAYLGLTRASSHSRPIF